MAALLWAPPAKSTLNANNLSKILLIKSGRNNCSNATLRLSLRFYLPRSPGCRAAARSARHGQSKSLTPWHRRCSLPRFRRLEGVATYRNYTNSYRVCCGSLRLDVFRFLAEGWDYAQRSRPHSCREGGPPCVRGPDEQPTHHDPSPNGVSGSHALRSSPTPPHGRVGSPDPSEGPRCPSRIAGPLHCRPRLGESPALHSDGPRG